MKRIGEVSTGSTLRLSLLGIIAIVVMLALGVEGVGAPLDPAGMLPDPVARKTPPVILPEPDTATKARIVEAYGKLPLSFEANRGQTDAQVKYLARGRGYTLFLTGTEAVLVFKNQPSAVSDQRSARTDHTKKTQKPSRTMLRMQLVGANPHPKVVAVDQLPGKSNYFIGNDPKKWRTNVPNYARVKYQDVYAGIDLIYYGNQRQLEYDLVVAPGADPKAITLAFEGADKLEINDQGDLVLQTVAGQVIQHAPVIYQEINGVKQAINGHYVLRGKDHVGIQVGPYDATTPLVIDPVVLTYSSYLGGGADDRGFGIAVDSASNAYVTGRTVSTGATAFPTTAGAFQIALGGGAFDAFVSKVNPAGDTLLYSSYLGGNNSDIGNAIAVDGNGVVYVTGSTASTNFPTTAGAFQTALASAGFTDAFMTKLNPAGTGAADLVYSTYLGGSNSDIGHGIALDGAVPPNAYVTGSTASTDFPTTAGAFQTALADAPAVVTDAFVSKLNPDPTGPTPDPNDLIYSTYLGGSLADIGNGIALDSMDNTYVTGSTASANFPTADTPFQPTLGGVIDAFVTKLNPAGTGAADLVYSTYLGGLNSDIGNGIALDGAATPNSYVTGETATSELVVPPFPIASFQATFGGVTDAFISKITESAAAPAPAPGAGDGSGCFIATAAFGSALAPQVHILRQFRDQYLLTHSVGQAFVSLYYTVSPPLAGFIANSETLRAVARVGLVPIIGWAALIMWSPGLAFGLTLVFLGLGTRHALRFAQQRQNSSPFPQTKEGRQSIRSAFLRRLAVWSYVLFVLAAATFLEAGQEDRPKAASRVEVVGDVGLPQVTRFGLIRDPKSAHLGLYKDGEAIFAGEQPLPVGKVVAVHDHALVITLASGQAVEIPQGARLPGPHGLVFVRSVLIDTLRFQIRVAAAGTPDRNYSVVDILGRRAILQRDAIPGESRTATLAEMVNTIPFVEVAPDTWEVPRQSVKQLGNHVAPLLTETLRSASPTVTMKDGVGLKLHNSLGSGTLDRRGFKIGYAKMAQRTGLEVGDVIISVNEQPVNSAGGLFRIYRTLKSDSTVSEVKVVIERNNTLRTLTYRIR